MQTTRQAVLQALQLMGRASVNDLAESVGVKAVTVRHHLNGLLADGLVQVEEQRQPVGRPLHYYSLSAQGRAGLPQQYNLLIGKLLDQMKVSLSPSMVNKLMDSLADAIAQDIREEVADLEPHQRMRHLIEILEREGFVAHWQQTDEGIRLVEIQCPYYNVGQRHPEICQIDETLIRTALDAEVKRNSCLLTGDNVCTYILDNA